MELLITTIIIQVVVETTAIYGIYVYHYKTSELERRRKLAKDLMEGLKKNREWYNKDDKTIIYEVNPMFNKLYMKQHM